MIPFASIVPLASARATALFTPASRRSRRPGVRIGPVAMIVTSLTLFFSDPRGARGQNGPAILTPPSPPEPLIHGAQIFGARPGAPFLFTIPATGDLPIRYEAAGLPEGLKLDPQTGQISGSAAQRGSFTVTLKVSNAVGRSQRELRIEIGERLALTPPMGWNSWNCWAESVDQEKVVRAAQAMAASGLIRHGWTYVNIDDTWQGARSGPDHALQPNSKFPDIRAMAEQIHKLGLKAGIYSTPWTTSYAKFAGGSSENTDGAWSPPVLAPGARLKEGLLPLAVGAHHFMAADARQWAAWGFDYLKYDWSPIDPANVEEMGAALRASGRDIVYSLSNSAPFAEASDWARLANTWRTTGDIRDNWQSMGAIGFSQSRWAPFAGPGHWNDPDMLVVGRVGWGPSLHQSRLTPNEQYTHISLWCLLSAPLLIGCDLDRLDPFTLGLLTNDEVIALDQDPLGRSAVRVARQDFVQIWAKPLADGSVAVGLFNLGEDPAAATLDWEPLGLSGPQIVRDVWRQRDVGVYDARFDAPIAPHGVFLIRLRPAAAGPGQ